RRGISKRSHLRAVAGDFVLAVSQVGLTILFLPFHTWLMADAILRTLARLCVTRRRLLQWVTSAQAAAGLDFELAGFYRRMAGGTALAAAAALLVAVLRPGSWPWAAPLLLLWLAAPAVARWISLPAALEQATPL